VGSANLDWGVIVAGSVVAAVVGVAAIWALVALLQRRAFHAFAPYCWAAGSLFLLYLAMR
jgi:undecaprenyl pyrophosphate phosphatase UppP